MLGARALGAALMAAVAVWGVAREAAGQPAAPKKYALLIGMNTYSNGFITGKVPELKWAVDDAKALAAALTDLGYDTTVIPKTEATRRRIIEALNYFATKATENDSFILYYAGHGVRNKIINEQTYWLTWDSELEALDPSGLRLSHLFDYVKDIKAKRKLILLDHCFAGDLVRDLSSPSPAAAPSAAGPAPALPPAATDGSRGGSDTAVSIRSV